ncbi:MAG TPA: prolyl oligopeptidase family serine peptidase [Verrucomicrobiae bacterium]|nr:prolyl oligopeptidase family serine peptidase [Verrucomicrobiae bacterium]
MRTALFLAASLTLASLPAFALQYPETRRGDVVDDYFGTRVPDPYRWLEDTDAAATADWVAAQNKVSLPFLAALPTRATYQKRLTELWNYERYGVPERKAGRLFYTRNDGLQNQAVLYVQDAPGAAPRVLLDPNTLSKDGTVALTNWEVSPDAQWLAYGLSVSGSDWNEFKVMEIATGKDRPDSLKRIKFSGMSWTADSRGFFYSRFPDAPKELKPDQVFEELAYNKLYYHRIGEAQEKDTLIYERPDQPKWGFNGEVSDDGRFLWIKIGAGTDSDNALSYKYLGEPGSTTLDKPVVPLVERIESMFEPIGNEASVVYLLTTHKAPRKRIIAIDLRSPDRKHWVPVVPETGDPIEDALIAGRQFVVIAMRDAHQRLQRYALNGNPLPELPMPGLGSVTNTPAAGLHISGDAALTELFYSYTDFSHPPQNQRCDLVKGTCDVFQPVKLAFNPDDYTTEQVFYRSKDGTRVPMFISYRKGHDRKAGPRAVKLYGYGGFEYAQVPSFARVELSVPALAWMEQGGLYAVANLRGGGEYGKAWHEAGIKGRKQNVFDDFIAAAEYLIKQGYTTTPQLAIHGRSNGGLLVGAVVNQRPDLFGAAVADVGVMDMLRFHKFTIGWAWVDDYGSSDDKAGFKYLHAYSPYHNLKPGTKYPAVLATTADHDDRVVPGHSFKYAAALQAAQAGDKPVLIRVDVKSGHGSGKPTGKLIEEVADRLAFITEYTRVSKP